MEHCIDANIDALTRYLTGLATHSIVRTQICVCTGMQTQMGNTNSDLKWLMEAVDIRLNPDIKTCKLCGARLQTYEVPIAVVTAQGVYHKVCPGVRLAPAKL